MAFDKKMSPPSPLAMFSKNVFQECTLLEYSPLDLPGYSFMQDSGIFQKEKLFIISNIMES